MHSPGCFVATCYLIRALDHDHSRDLVAGASSDPDATARHHTYINPLSAIDVLRPKSLRREFRSRTDYTSTIFAHLGYFLADAAYAYRSTVKVTTPRRHAIADTLRYPIGPYRSASRPAAARIAVGVR